MARNTVLLLVVACIIVQLCSIMPPAAATSRLLLDQPQPHYEKVQKFGILGGLLGLGSDVVNIVTDTAKGLTKTVDNILTGVVNIGNTGDIANNDEASTESSIGQLDIDTTRGGDTGPSSNIISINENADHDGTQHVAKNDGPRSSSGTTGNGIGTTKDNPVVGNTKPSSTTGKDDGSKVVSMKADIISRSSSNTNTEGKTDNANGEKKARSGGATSESGNGHLSNDGSKSNPSAGNTSPSKTNSIASTNIDVSINGGIKTSSDNIISADKRSKRNGGQQVIRNDGHPSLRSTTGTDIKITNDNKVAGHNNKLTSTSTTGGSNIVSMKADIINSGSSSNTGLNGNIDSANGEKKPITRGTSIESGTGRLNNISSRSSTTVGQTSSSNTNNIGANNIKVSITGGVKSASRNNFSVNESADRDGTQHVAKNDGPRSSSGTPGNGVGTTKDNPVVGNTKPSSTTGKDDGSKVVSMKADIISRSSSNTNTEGKTDNANGEKKARSGGATSESGNGRLSNDGSKSNPSAGNTSPSKTNSIASTNIDVSINGGIKTSSDNIISADKRSKRNGGQQVIRNDGHPSLRSTTGTDIKITNDNKVAGHNNKLTSTSTTGGSNIVSMKADIINSGSSSNTGLNGNIDSANGEKKPITRGTSIESGTGRLNNISSRSSTTVGQTSSSNTNNIGANNIKVSITGGVKSASRNNFSVNESADRDGTQHVAKNDGPRSSSGTPGNGVGTTKDNPVVGNTKPSSTTGKDDGSKVVSMKADIISRSSSNTNTEGKTDNANGEKKARSGGATSESGNGRLSNDGSKSNPSAGNTSPSKTNSIASTNIDVSINGGIKTSSDNIISADKRSKRNGGQQVIRNDGHPSLRSTTGTDIKITNDNKVAGHNNKLTSTSTTGGSNIVSMKADIINSGSSSNTGLNGNIDSANGEKKPITRGTSIESGTGRLNNISSRSSTTVGQTSSSNTNNIGANNIKVSITGGVKSASRNNFSVNESADRDGTQHVAKNDGPRSSSGTPGNGVGTTKDNPVVGNTKPSSTTGKDDGSKVVSMKADIISRSSSNTNTEGKTDNANGEKKARSGGATSESGNGHLSNDGSKSNPSAGNTSPSKTNSIASTNIDVSINGGIKTSSDNIISADKRSKRNGGQQVIRNDGHPSLRSTTGTDIKITNDNKVAGHNNKLTSTSTTGGSNIVSMKADIINSGSSSNTGLNGNIDSANGEKKPITRGTSIESGTGRLNNISSRSSTTVGQTSSSNTNNIGANNIKVSITGGVKSASRNNFSVNESADRDGTQHVAKNDGPRSSSGTPGNGVGTTKDNPVVGNTKPSSTTGKDDGSKVVSMKADIISRSSSNTNTEGKTDNANGEKKARSGGATSESGNGHLSNDGSKSNPSAGNTSPSKTNSIASTNIDVSINGGIKTSSDNIISADKRSKRNGGQQVIRNDGHPSLRSTTGTDIKITNDNKVAGHNNKLTSTSTTGGSNIVSMKADIINSGSSSNTGLNGNIDIANGEKKPITRGTSIESGTGRLNNISSRSSTTVGQTSSSNTNNIGANNIKVSITGGVKSASRNNFLVNESADRDGTQHVAKNDGPRSSSGTPGNGVGTTKDNPVVGNTKPSSTTGKDDGSKVVSMKADIISRSSSNTNTKGKTDNANGEKKARRGGATSESGNGHLSNDGSKSNPSAGNTSPSKTNSIASTNIDVSINGGIKTSSDNIISADKRSKRNGGQQVIRNDGHPSLRSTTGTDIKITNDNKVAGHNNKLTSTSTTGGSNIVSMKADIINSGSSSNTGLNGNIDSANGEKKPITRGTSIESGTGRLNNISSRSSTTVGQTSSSNTNNIGANNIKVSITGGVKSASRNNFSVNESTDRDGTQHVAKNDGPRSSSGTPGNGVGTTKDNPVVGNTKPSSTTGKDDGSKVVSMKADIISRSSSNTNTEGKTDNANGEKKARSGGATSESGNGHLSNDGSKSNPSAGNTSPSKTNSIASTNIDVSINGGIKTSSDNIISADKRSKRNGDQQVIRNDGHPSLRSTTGTDIKITNDNKVAGHNNKLTSTSTTGGSNIVSMKADIINSGSSSNTDLNGNIDIANGEKKPITRGTLIESGTGRLNNISSRSSTTVGQTSSSNTNNIGANNIKVSITGGVKSASRNNFSVNESADRDGTQHVAKNDGPRSSSGTPGNGVGTTKDNPVVGNTKPSSTTGKDDGSKVVSMKADIISRSSSNTNTKGKTDNANGEKKARRGGATSESGNGHLSNDGSKSNPSAGNTSPSKTNSIASTNIDVSINGGIKTSSDNIISADKRSKRNGGQQVIRNDGHPSLRSTTGTDIKITNDNKVAGHNNKLTSTSTTGGSNIVSMKADIINSGSSSNTGLNGNIDSANGEKKPITRGTSIESGTGRLNNISSRSTTTVGQTSSSNINNIGANNIKVSITGGVKSASRNNFSVNESADRDGTQHVAKNDGPRGSSGTTGNGVDTTKDNHVDGNSKQSSTTGKDDGSKVVSMKADIISRSSSNTNTEGKIDNANGEKKARRGGATSESGNSRLSNDGSKSNPSAGNTSPSKTNSIASTNIDVSINGGIKTSSDNIISADKRSKRNGGQQVIRNDGHPSLRSTTGTDIKITNDNKVAGHNNKLTSTSTTGGSNIVSMKADIINSGSSSNTGLIGNTDNGNGGKKAIMGGASIESRTGRLNNISSRSNQIVGHTSFSNTNNIGANNIKVAITGGVKSASHNNFSVNESADHEGTQHVAKNDGPGNSSGSTGINVGTTKDNRVDGNPKQSTTTGKDNGSRVVSMKTDIISRSSNNTNPNRNTDSANGDKKARSGGATSESVTIHLNNDGSKRNPSAGNTGLSSTNNLAGRNIDVSINGGIKTSSDNILSANQSAKRDGSQQVFRNDGHLSSRSTTGNDIEITNENHFASRTNKLTTTSTTSGSNIVAMNARIIKRSSSNTGLNGNTDSASGEKKAITIGTSIESGTDRLNSISSRSNPTFGHTRSSNTKKIGVNKINVSQVASSRSSGIIGTDVKITHDN
ncbi:hypothetical protein ACP70R_030150 [Stipagrostis hirtigluma subsp. patula]